MAVVAAGDVRFVDGSFSRPRLLNEAVAGRGGCEGEGGCGLIVILLPAKGVAWSADWGQVRAGRCLFS